MNNTDLKYKASIKNTVLFIAIGVFFFRCASPEKESFREIINLGDAWKFQLVEDESAEVEDLNDRDFSVVEIPHDWAIKGPFDMSIDTQKVSVIADGEFVARVRYGRTGALPHIGIGWYQKELDIPKEWEDKVLTLLFDGVMSNATVYVNGKPVGGRPYGYSSFYVDITKDCITGKSNLISVRVENKPKSSRWYPGAGIYRKVRLIVTDPVHIPIWGTYITTPEVDSSKARVRMAININGLESNSEGYFLETSIYNANRVKISSQETKLSHQSSLPIMLEFPVPNPELWSPGNPVMYNAVCRILKDGVCHDEYHTAFGIREYRFTADSGFFLNGVNMKLKGVCLHHDLGPLGSAVNKSAIYRQLYLLREMGCNAIRTSHNPPAPELLELCDSIGFLAIVEAFDEWSIPKVENGYNKNWEEWAEKDLSDMIRRDRNHPSVIMWSIGNEILEQKYQVGAKYCQFLTDICHKEDPTRPVTAGFNHWKDAIKFGLADIVDVVGWNYKPGNYLEVHRKFPHWKMYGSETASTVSSRGEYFFPDKPCVHCVRESGHASSYDMDFPRWATTPDREFAAQDSFAFMAGEFVWTGFDYLGEPTPYNESPISRSSYFGIMDLCGIPKDRFFLYKSQWSDKEVLHILPHWNWVGKEDSIIPVHVYSSFNKAELFLNGRSLGLKEKDDGRSFSKYRIVWDSVQYEPGELKVVTYDVNGIKAGEANRITAGEPFSIVLEGFRTTISYDEKEYAFITAGIYDKTGNACPLASDLIDFKIDGPGRIVATGNGDPTNLRSFAESKREAFNGKCLLIIEGLEKNSTLNILATAKGLKQGKIKIKVK